MSCYFFHHVEKKRNSSGRDLARCGIVMASLIHRYDRILILTCSVQSQLNPSARCSIGESSVGNDLITTYRTSFDEIISKFKHM